MKSTPPLLAPILRSDTQGRLLAGLMVDPARELSLTDLAGRVGVAVPTILRDIDRLIAGRYLVERRVGRSRLVRIDTTHPLYRSLRHIVLYGYGPEAVLTELVNGTPGLEKAVIYGSWAARYRGEEGDEPGDVDVLLIGEVERADLYALARHASEAIGREVNVSGMTLERWNDARDGFVQTVRSRPLVELDTGRVVDTRRAPDARDSGPTSKVGR